MYAWTFFKQQSVYFSVCVRLSPLLHLFIFSWHHGTVTRDTHNIANKNWSLKPQGWIADTAQLWHSTVYPFSLHRKMVYPRFKFGFCLTFVAILKMIEPLFVNMFSSSIAWDKFLGPLLHYVSCFGKSFRAHNRPCHPSLPLSHSSPQCHQAPKVEFLGGRKPMQNKGDWMLWVQ